MCTVPDVCVKLCVGRCSIHSSFLCFACVLEQFCFHTASLILPTHSSFAWTADAAGCPSVQPQVADEAPLDQPGWQADAGVGVVGGAGNETAGPLALRTEASWRLVKGLDWLERLVPDRGSRVVAGLTRR